MDRRALFGLVVFCYVTFVVAYNTCKQTGEILQLFIDNKLEKNEPGQPPVVLTKGSNATLTVIFKPSTNSKSATSKCYGYIHGVMVPFPVEPNGCNEVKPGCPLLAGKVYNFTTQIEVKKLYPDITLVIMWQELDDNGDPIFCFDLGAQIKS